MQPKNPLSKVMAQEAIAQLNTVSKTVEVFRSEMNRLTGAAPSDDPAVRFLDKKRAEGKVYHVSMTAGCNKFPRIYCGRVKEFMNTMDTPVDLDSTGLSR